MHHCQETPYSAPACFPVDTELIVTPFIHDSMFEVHESSPIVPGVLKGISLLKVRLKLFQKVGSFPQCLRVCLSRCFSCDPCLSAGCRCYWWNCRVVLHMVSSSFSPSAPFSQFLHVLVDVCGARVGRAGRAISFVVEGFAFALPLTSLKRVNLHRVIVCARCISS